MRVRLGDLLVRRGALTPAQRDEILAQQRGTGRPFGAIAEERFGICPRDVEQAWAEQYAADAPTVDPSSEQPDPSALQLLDRREAWQFRIVPLRFDGPELMLATSAENLPRALRFVGWRLNCACFFVVAEPDALQRALERHYPFAGTNGTGRSASTARYA